MPPKVDPSEVRISKYFATQLTSRSSEDKLVPQQPLLPNSVLSAWYHHNNKERQKGRIRYRKGRRQVERNQSNGPAQVPKQSCGNHHKP